jgi:Iron-containing redox enzyme
MRLPTPRGPLSGHLVAALAGPPGLTGEAPAPADDPLAGEDFPLALYTCYELHYRGFDGVDERWEWEPSLLALRASLEERFEERLRELAGDGGAEPDAVAAELGRLIAEDDAPSLARYLEREATIAQFREFVVHRSAYHLKEADPHSFAIARLSGRPKSALVEIQADEYGSGMPERMHSHLFARTMEALGLDCRYGALLDHIPGPTLATVNLMSFLGLHRRHRGAIAGHLAVFEMTSSEPNRRYGNALRRLGYGSEATGFYDEHVEADAVHEAIAANDLAGTLAREEPALAADILFGARALLRLDGLVAQQVIERWQRGESSLRTPLAAAGG